MKDLLSILRDAPGSIRLEVSGEDLLAFSKSLIDRAKEELATQVAEARKERYLTKEQVKELCGICDATLWHWNRKGYLKAVKVGNKVRYRTSDIQRILGEQDGK
jgi:predicted DNA-binding transcriptional regulator AlpA